ncbi:AAA family ATPase [Okeania sp. SIO3I5]|uniref:trifunctional serine/threonine-protein kinase/ATP-binding protein/sensor histidine kinase n=1 Tax=Okeania sp. SIO3I5 TaxID=2607805 RepID=UPI0025CFAC1F|nr:AAA family ATPase [Okeania sp. SIO3I5]
MLPNLPNYQITEQLYAGTRTVVYRGIRRCDEEPIVIKLLRNKYPNFNEIVQFRNQYTIAQNLDFPNIIKPLSLEVYDNGYVLIMEDMGGISLSNYLEIATDKNDRYKYLSLTEFLEIAIRLTETLHYLYQNRVIHKDIKPANILINPDTKQIKLIDFSIASLLPRETQEIQNPNILEGTLAYISPEQTGRMNRGIDYRSDFYSLGVTFYELLTGKLPFISEDVMELLHFHLAIQPREIHEINSQIPPVLSKIVSKLMAKNAENRYQSALGIKHDLEKCLTQLQQIGKISDFELGKRDISDRFMVPEKLYGRETEVNQLLDAFERVSNLSESSISNLSETLLSKDKIPPQFPLGKGGKESPPTPLGKEKIPPQSPLSKGEEESPPTPLGKGEEESPPTPLGKGGAELMLVAGFSGIGKTAVINEVHKPIVRQQGYFIQGKYDQFNRNIPFSAFVQAFRDLMRQLLSESEAKIEIWKTNILAAVGENGKVLIDVIPELENIIGKQPQAIELSGTAAQNRFNLLFQKFVKVFTRKEHPLVMFLDDLQWADSASLNLLKLLLQDTEYLLLLGAYRDNEVSPIHPLILTLDELIKTEAMVNTITLSPLTESDLNQLVADTLNCESSLAQPLTKLVYQKTKGNPFFATQFLKALYDDKLICFNWDIQHWECDISQVKTLAITDDVVEFMALQLQKLPTETQEIIKLAACVGAGFDLQTLAIVSEQSEINIATLLWKALQESLILPVSDVYKFYQLEENDNFSHKDENYQKQNARYRFLHDRVQQAAYSLIPDAQKQTTHLKIGQLLQKNLSATEKEEKLFDIVGHFNIAIELITQPIEREILARLNLAAGQKARNSTAYVAARNFVQIGINLLPKNCWENQYELTLNLYVAAAETAYLNADFDAMEEIAALILRAAQTILDKVKIFEIQINALTTQSQMLEAISVGTKALTELGIELPSQTDEALTRNALENLACQLEGKEISELVNLPVMSNPQKMAAMELLGILFPAVFMGNPALQPLLCSRMVSLSLEYGNAPASTIGYMGYGIVLSDFLGEVEKGYCFGQVARSLLYQLNAREYKSITLLWFTCFIQHRQEAMMATIPTAKEAYLAGMETGDFLNAGYSINSYFYNNFFAGVEIDTWAAEIENYCFALTNVKQYSPIIYLKETQQMVHNLREIVNQPDFFGGPAYDETVMFPKHHQDLELTALAIGYNYKLMLAYVFGNYTNCLEYIPQANSYLMVAGAMIHTIIFHFYAGLAYLAVCSTQSEIEQAKTLEQVKTYQTTLAEWAVLAPMNHQHKLDLVEAEKCRVLGENYQAADYYDRAIAGAKENNYIQEEAMANELAAKFYLHWGKEKVAAGYIQEAYYCYTRWGAKGKVAYLEEKYPQLLEVILQATNSASISEETISRTLTRSINTATNTQSSNLLDFPAVMKAAQAISEEIELEKLLATLMQIAIANGGAETGFLVIHQQAEWFVVAKANQNHTENLQIPLVQCQELPQSLIYSVARSKKIAVFDNLSAICQFAGDRYIITHQPRSVLCTPISKQGKLVAILYLENNLTVGTFTNDRVETLQILTSQAAISIENARLYQQVENYSQTLEIEVEKKTEALSQKAFDLEQALTNLQQTQAQLIHSEKMSSLGQIVAGVAHEINNPINFIHGNIKPASQHVNDLLDLITAYQNTYPKPTSEIEAIIEDLDLDFLVEDLQKLLGSMQTGSKRIRDIVASLRNFSRLDESEIKKADIHEGIESTLLILQHRLHSFEEENCGRKYLEITAIKNYGKLPLVTCYPNQLNQVFLNILNNAIDALNEVSLQGKKSDFIPNITITTATTESRFIEIKIADNGSGIPPEIVNKIFDPFFTTKPVGSGTGLGLYTSYQIVVERHSGELICVSNLGQGTEFIIKVPIA